MKRKIIYFVIVVISILALLSAGLFLLAKKTFLREYNNDINDSLYVDIASNERASEKVDVGLNFNNDDIVTPKSDIKDGIFLPDDSSNEKTNNDNHHNLDVIVNDNSDLIHENNSNNTQVLNLNNEDKIINNKPTVESHNQEPKKDKEPLTDIGTIYYKKPTSSDIVKDQSGIKYVKNQILISGIMGRNDKKVIEEISSDIGAEIVGYIELTNDYQIELNKEMSLQDLEMLVDYFNSMSFISYASINYVDDSSGDFNSNDKLYNNNEYAILKKDSSGKYITEFVEVLNNNPKADRWDDVNGDNWGLEALNVPQLWNHKSEFASVKVGIIDNGFLDPEKTDKVDNDIVFEHIFGNTEDRYSSMEKDYIYNAGKEKMDHGLGVAGVLAAKFNNEKGISGIPTNALLYAYEMGSNTISRMEEKCAFALLIGNNVKVINYSRGYDLSFKSAACIPSNKNNELMKNANTYISNSSFALEENLRKYVYAGYDYIIVTSAGNDRNSKVIEDENEVWGWRLCDDKDSLNPDKKDAIIDPKFNNALCFIDENSLVGQRILAVGSVNYSNNSALGKTDYICSDFSNLGDRVDFYAPGERILTLAPQYKNNCYYSLESGTSISAPFVSGIIASMYQVNPKLKSRYIKSYLMAGSREYYDKNEKMLIPDAENCYQLAKKGNSEIGDLSSLPSGIVYGNIIGIDENKVKKPIKDVSIIAIRKDIGESRVEEECVSFKNDSAGDFTQSLPQGKYDLIISHNDYLPFVKNDVLIESGKALYVGDIILQKWDSVFWKNYYVEGKISNAINGDVVANAKICFRKGWNNQEGDYVKDSSGNIVCATTNAEGYFLIKLLQGCYTAEITCDEYVTGYFNVVPSDNLEVINFTISPLLSEDECRIILTWSDIPEDLDAHLTYYKDNSQRFHISFSDKVASTNGEGGATLDLDDVESYGPETVTIKSVHSILENGGILKFSVHNFSSYKSDDKMELSMSDAVVRVYMGNNLIETIYIPVKKEGNVWYVFELTEEGIDIKNEFYNAESEEVK